MASDIFQIGSVTNIAWQAMGLLTQVRLCITSDAVHMVDDLTLVFVDNAVRWALVAVCYIFHFVRNATVMSDIPLSKASGVLHDLTVKSTLCCFNCAHDRFSTRSIFVYRLWFWSQETWTCQHFFIMCLKWLHCSPLGHCVTPHIGVIHLWASKAT